MWQHQNTVGSEIRLTSWGKGRLSHHLHGVYTSPGGFQPPDFERSINSSVLVALRNLTSPSDKNRLQQGHRMLRHWTRLTGRSQREIARPPGSKTSKATNHTKTGEFFIADGRNPQTTTRDDDYPMYFIGVYTSQVVQDLCSINRIFRLCDGVLRATCLTYMLLPFTKKGGLWQKHHF